MSQSFQGRSLPPSSTITRLEYHAPLNISSTAALYGKTLTMASLLQRGERRVFLELHRLGCVIEECVIGFFYSTADPLYLRLEECSLPFYMEDSLQGRVYDAPGFFTPPPGAGFRSYFLERTLQRIRSELLVPLLEPDGIPTGYFRLTSPLPRLGWGREGAAVASHLLPLLQQRARQTLFGLKLSFAHHWRPLPFPALYIPHPRKGQRGVLSLQMIPSQRDLGTGSLVRFRWSEASLPRLGWVHTHLYTPRRVHLVVVMEEPHESANRERPFPEKNPLPPGIILPDNTPGNGKTASLPMAFSPSGERLLD